MPRKRLSLGLLSIICGSISSGLATAQPEPDLERQLDQSVKRHIRGDIVGNPLDLSESEPTVP